MFADPVKNLKTLGLKENDIVADLGAGTGFYAVAAGKLVPKGKVYAVEIVKDFLTTIKNKIKEAHLSNVQCLLGDIETVGGTNLADGIIDVVIASNVLFQVEKKDEFVAEIKRILKSGGRVLFIDWVGEAVQGSFPKSPADTFAFKLKVAVPKEQARAIFEKSGFTWQEDINAGAHHYGMILSKL